MRHTIVLFVFKIMPTRRERLAALLESWAPLDGGPGEQLGFGEVESVHFASVSVLDRPLLDPLLVIECNVDGALEPFIGDWVGRARGLPELLSCCGVAPGGDLRTALRAAAILPIAQHVGAVGLSRPEILASHQAVEAAREVLRVNESDWSRLEPGEVAERLRRTRSVMAPIQALGDAPRRTMEEHAADWGALLLPVAGAAAVAGLALRRRPLLTTLTLATGLGAAALALRRAEEAEPVRERSVEPKVEAIIDTAAGPGYRPQPIAEWENRPGRVQNHYISYAPLKTGPLRWLTLRLFMGALARVAAVFHREGSLGGIPSIHFAHWAVVDQGSALLFMSNYGGTWESYLDDFIEKAHVGLTGVWSHCQGFPRSRWLVQDGATREKAFKRYVRDSQHREALWWVAYPTLTTGRINSNRVVVEGLRGRGDPAEWLRRI